MRYSRIESMLRSVLLLAVLLLCSTLSLRKVSADFAEMERQFIDQPMEARRMTGPLFWLHGDANETRERLEFYLGKVAEGHNGTFCAESRPHTDWLGPKWFEDLSICLEAAKKLDMKMWIFDEKWWPSQGVGGQVPERYAAKRLEAQAQTVNGPVLVEQADFSGERFVAAIAGRLGDEGVDPDSLIDLHPFIKGGRLEWSAPTGTWQVMSFTWTHAPRASQGGQALVDGASRDCVEWFIQTVYQPHYDRFKDDFGKTIVGFFYDEPETQGDWGTELSKTFEQRGVDWKKAFVAYKFKLAGDMQAAGKYAYLDAFFETWGREMYGGITRWCEERNVASIGHFMEHNGLYLNHGLGAGNLMQMQKYSSMGGMDLVCRQLYPGQRNRDYYMPKIVSSISHAYDKKDDLTMCEIYGGYNQVLTYAQMKWLVDQHQLMGVNFMITHSFNPKAPNDTDYPPYFFNNGLEPRWPMYRVWADYTNRLSGLLTGGRHVAPVALLFLGNSHYVGRSIAPEQITGALQSALFDCDWLPYDVFEENSQVRNKELVSSDEKYRVLIVPPVEAIPYATMLRVRDFFLAGGTVLGYGFTPTISASLDRSSEEVVALVGEVWGKAASPGLEVLKTNAAGGRSYLLPLEPTAEQLQQVLTGDAGIHPTLEVIEGETDGWLHVLHRVKDGSDVFFVCNQNYEGEARQFRLRARAEGVPERWDAMRGEITTFPYRRVASGSTVEFDLTLEPSESALIVFRQTKPDDSSTTRHPAQLVSSGVASVKTLPVERVHSPEVLAPTRSLVLDECSWVWYPEEGDPSNLAPPGKRYLRTSMHLPGNGKVSSAQFLLSADNEFVLYVNGREAGRNAPGANAWRQPATVDFASLLRAGENTFAVEVCNATDKPSPAGVIGRWRVEFSDDIPPQSGAIDKSWKVAATEEKGWLLEDYNDSKWPMARSVARYGEGPWGRLDGKSGPAIPPADPFRGVCVIPADMRLSDMRVYLEMDAPPRAIASVTVNGQYAGGSIGSPFRLDITGRIHVGNNKIEIAPYAPEHVRMVFVEEKQ